MGISGKRFYKGLRPYRRMAVYLPRSTVSEYMRIDWETVGRCVHRTLNEIEPERSSKGTVYLSPCTFKLEHQLPAKEKRTDPDGKVTEIRYTCEEIIRTLRGMRVTAVSDTGYVPSYTRTTLTDALPGERPKVKGAVTRFRISCHSSRGNRNSKTNLTNAVFTASVRFGRCIRCQRRDHSTEGGGWQRTEHVIKYYAVKQNLVPCLCRGLEAHTGEFLLCYNCSASVIVGSRQRTPSSWLISKAFDENYPEGKLLQHEDQGIMAGCPAAYHLLFSERRGV